MKVNNTVSVEVLDHSTVAPTQFAAISDRVTLRVSQVLGQPALCNARPDCTPHRGGIQINGDIWSCTFGANARFNSVIRTITSGHCDTARNNEWDDWNHWNTQGQDTYIGHSHFNGLHNGLDVDVLRIGVVGTQTRNPYNRIYSSEANRSVIINGVLSNAQIFVGLDVRRAGQFTQKNGEINGPYYKYWFLWDDGVWTAWGRASSATSISGDSGGPVWHFTANGTAQLLGFNSLADGTFATQEDAARVLNLQHFCTDSDC